MPASYESPLFHADDDYGRPSVGGQLYTYLNKTTTPAPSYQDAAGAAFNTNPVILNARGEAIVFLPPNQAYTFVLKDKNNVLVWSQDDIVANLSAVDLGTAEGATFIGFKQSGAGSVLRTVQKKLEEIVSVGDFSGADPSGETDSDVAIDAAMDETVGPYFPDGVFRYTGDVDALFDRQPFGPGSIRFDGYDYPVARQRTTNAMWPGGFNVWSMGHALGTLTTQRIMIPSGVTHARIGLAAGTTISHVQGEHSADAMRIQRNMTNADASTHVAVINLSREETKPLAGRRCVLEFNGAKGSTYTGASVGYRVQYSLEPEQPILNPDGTYTNGQQVLASGSVELAESGRPEFAPYWVSFDVPEHAIQVAAVFTVPFAGVAGEDDFIELESVRMYPGAAPQALEQTTLIQQESKAATRHQTSYPYGAPRGAATEQGAVSAVGVTTALQWSFSIPIKFNPPMVVPPQFLFQSPTSGTESRLLDKDTGATINGLAWDLSERGAVITNNGAPTVGHRYLCHWTATVLF